jgi:hypothetical protein
MREIKRQTKKGKERKGKERKEGDNNIFNKVNNKVSIFRYY